MLVFIKNFFTKTNKQQSSLETLQSKKEKMKAELDSLYEFEFFLKELKNQS